MNRAECRTPDACRFPNCRCHLWYLVEPVFDPVRDVKEFHEKMGIEYSGKPRMLDFELLQFRLKFMREEIAEYEKHSDAALHELDKHPPGKVHDEFAFDNAHFVHEMSESLDALVDLMYVTLGTAYLQGYDIKTAWARVHAANMAKQRAATADSAGSKFKLKVVKPKGWEPPKHDDLVEDHAHGK